MGTHEEGTSFENKLAHFVEGLSGLDYTDAIWFLTEVKRAAEESTQLSRANAELRAALVRCIDNLEYIERQHPECTGLIERRFCIIAAREQLTTTEAKK